MLRLDTDRFELLRQVGEGSYGVVFEARDRQTAGLVAIKLLHDGDEVAEERFEREAVVLAELQHPAIVRYVAHGSAADGRRYLAMEWLAGRTLEKLVHAKPPLLEVLSLARRVVSGLAFASLRGVTHRDIKPANLFLVDGAASATKILDFGLARRTSDRQRLTQTGFVIGTPLYMSPEQARGDLTIDARTDVFSLGSVLYTCLCGQEPFYAEQPLATLAKICFEEPRPIEQLAPQAPASLTSLVHAMMRKKREERPTLRSITEQLAEITEQQVSSERARLRASLPDDGSMTMNVAAADLSSGRAGSSLHRRGRVANHRIVAAVFVSPASTLSAEHEAELHRAATRYGARVERLLDGSLIVLPSQQLGASEQAVIAARCSIALRQLLQGRARLAVCTGRAMVVDVQPLGELLERGAALLASTPAGVVRVDQASASLLEARFELGADDSLGRTLERERSGGEAPRTLLGQPTSFVGRERELQQLQLTFGECVDELVARVVLVTAPPGAGKSRLRHELIERLHAAGPSFTLLVGRGDSMRGGTQFGVLASALHGWAELAGSDSLELKRDKLSSRIGALVPGARAIVLAHFLGEMIGVPFPEQASPQLRAARVDHQLMADHMLASWLEWLEALTEREPVLFCVEDLHWSDPASLRFIEAALRNARERALMVLALARPEAHESFPQLWAERDLMEIRLPKLGARACARLLEALRYAPESPALRAAMIERADGNPFFLEELVRGVATSGGKDALPETILAMVQARLDALGEEPRSLLRAASVFGQSFRLVGVRALFGDEAEQFDFEGVLALLSEREILFRSGPVSEQEYQFRHALIRDAAYLLLHDDDRALGHRLAAGWLEQNAAAPALLADHYERGGMPTSAAHWWARAAAQAFEAGSLDDVLRCGERAIGCGASGDELGQLAALLAEARSYCQDDAGAAAWAERARASLSAGAPAWWRATQVGAVAYLRLGSPELDVLAAQMIARFSPEQELPEQTLAVAYLMSECLRLMRDELGARLFSLLPPELPQALLGRPEGCLVSARAIKSFQAGNLSEALRFARTALRAQRGAGAMRDVCDTLGLCGYFLHELGAYEEAEGCLLEEVQLGQRIGSTRDICYAQLYLGSIYARSGRHDAAERTLSEALKGYEKLALPSYQLEALCHLIGVQCARGELEQARCTSERALLLDLAEPAPRAYLRARASTLSLLSGRVEEALQQARSAHQLMRENDVTEFFAMIEVSYIESLLAAGEQEAAASALAEAQRWLEAQAAKIDEPTLRRGFLQQVPEHARIFQLAAATLQLVGAAAK
ncbi:MAG: Serine/threonine protein kinase [Myxococcaceae bacterium]|nr:Serine/threonine protein kinase [Myxococcaceae bacterium]